MRQEESREKEGMRAADEGTEERKRKMKRIKERKGFKASKNKKWEGQRGTTADENLSKPRQADYRLAAHDGATHTEHR